MGTPNRIIRDYRYEPEKALAHRKAVIAAEEGSRGRVFSCMGTNKGAVIPPYYPREPIPAGDPASPSGTKVELSELADDVLALIAAGGAGATGGFPIFTFARRAQVPNSGTLYLNHIDGVTASEVGLVLPAAVTITGLTISVNDANPTKDYRLELIDDPTGTPSVLAFVDLLATNRSNIDRSFSVSVPSGTELGMRVRRITGAGNSNPLDRIVGLAEYSILAP